MVTSAPPGPAGSGVGPAVNYTAQQVGRSEGQPSPTAMPLDADNSGPPGQPAVGFYSIDGGPDRPALGGLELGHAHSFDMRQVKPSRKLYAAVQT